MDVMNIAGLNEEKKVIVSKMQELLQKDPVEVSRDFHRMEKEFKKVWTEIFEEQKREFVEGGGKARDFMYIKNEEDIRFEQAVEKFKKKLNERKEELAREREKNLEQKKDIISRIRFLTSNSENVGAALKKLHELTTEWKSVGEVPPAFLKEINSEYQKALDEFHHNLRLYKELQEHDYKRNYELKSEIVQKILHLPEKYPDNIRDLQMAFLALKKEWNTIGPVPPDKWDDIKKQLSLAEEKIQEVFKKHREEIQKEQELNYQAKKAIHALMEKILQDSASFRTSDDWNKATDHWLDLQAKWKETGRVKEESFEELFREQRALSDAFFQKKKDFFEELHRRQAECRTMKTALAEEAEKLKDSQEWNVTTRKLQKLLEEWKKIPLIDKDPEESKLYIRFRKACQHFFDKKQEFFDKQKNEAKEEIEKRKEFLEKIRSIPVPENKSEVIELIRSWEDTWNQLGNSRTEEKKELSDHFYQFMRSVQNNIQLTKEEYRILKFESRLRQACSSPNPEEIFKKENFLLRKQFEETRQRLTTFENNKSFFRHAKSDNPMLKELEEKIRNEAEALKQIENKRTILKKIWEECKNRQSHSHSGKDADTQSPAPLA